MRRCLGLLLGICLIIGIFAAATFNADAVTVGGLPAQPRFQGVYVGAPGVFTNTQMNDPAQFIINNGNPQTLYQDVAGNLNTTDAVQAVVVGTTTSTVNQLDALSGYATAQSVPGNAFGLWAVGACSASSNGCNAWGLNVVATNRATGSSAGTSVTTVLTGGEYDVDPGNSGDSTFGVISLLNAEPATLASYTGGAAFLAGGNNRPAITWNVGYQVQDQGANVAFDSGAACASGSCTSQPIQFDYYVTGSRTSQNLKVNEGIFYFSAPLFVNTTGSTLAITSTGTQCTMSTSTTCTATVPSGSAHCLAEAQSATAFYSSCSITGGTTATVTANASNSVNWLIIATQ